MNPAVEVRRLGHAFGPRRVLDALSFSVAAGEFFIVIGPNGSGKTTLMKALAGLLPVQSGEVLILGKPLSAYRRKELARQVAYVPQGLPLEFPFSVAEVVLMGRAPYLGALGMEGARDREIAAEAMRFTDVAHLARRRLDQLSGGEQQRVLIARAVCQQPKVLLLDEPTASLDLAQQVRVMDLMETLRAERGTAVVMVSHDINLAGLYGRRLLLLEAGRCRRLGTPAEVLRRELLEQAYGCRVTVDESPFGGLPRVLVVPGKFRRSRGEGNP